MPRRNRNARKRAAIRTRRPPRPARRPPGEESPLEASLAIQLRAAGLTGWQREHRFHSSRGWQFDFAWPEQMLAVECEGGVYTGGRHVTGDGFTGDCVKYNTATLAGWRVLRVTGAHVKGGQALTWIQQALGVPPGELFLKPPPGRTPGRRRR